MPADEDIATSHSAMFEGHVLASRPLIGVARREGWSIRAYDDGLAREFGDSPEGTFTVVFRVRHSLDRTVQARVHARLERAARVLPGGRLGTFRAGGGVVYGELGTSLSLQRAKAYTERVRAAAGPGALVPKPLQDVQLHLRNIEALRRLAFVVDGRTR